MVLKQRTVHVGWFPWAVLLSSTTMAVCELWLQVQSGGGV
jgi:hypothetical protein